MMPMRLMLAMILLLATTSPMLHAGESSAPTPETLRVAAVQLRSTRGMDANVDRIIEHLQQLSAEGVQVAIFPECAVTGYFEDEATEATAEELGSAERRIALACRAAGIAAIVGTPYRDGEALYNSAVVIDSRGNVIERYHKIQLAEPWPTPGDHLSVFSIEGVPCSIIICHDERYPELVRLPVLAGARVIFYLSHESGIRQERKIDPYRAQIQARAVENSVYIVHANAPANDDLSGSHGQSRILDPDGTILEEASMFEEQRVQAALDLSRASAGNALRSVSRGPLTDWWREGIRQVRIIEAPVESSAGQD